MQVITLNGLEDSNATEESKLLTPLFLENYFGKP